jgi:hypothetical protein
LNQFWLIYASATPTHSLTALVLVSPIPARVGKKMGKLKGKDHGKGKVKKM